MGYNNWSLELFFVSGPALGQKNGGKRFLSSADTNSPSLVDDGEVPFTLRFKVIGRL
jgi:hypothetical protein